MEYNKNVDIKFNPDDVTYPQSQKIENQIV
jgi:hypothetical protein